MKVTATLDKDEVPGREQIERINRAAEQPVFVAEDSPVYNAEQLAFLYAETKKMNAKQTVGLRLSQQVIDRYKAFGKGYTGIMAAVLEYAMEHPDILKKAVV